MSKKLRWKIVNGRTPLPPSIASGKERLTARRERHRPSSSTAHPDRQRRVELACRNCRERKKRCDGAKPCSYCNEQGWDCEYQRSYLLSTEANTAFIFDRIRSPADHTNATAQSQVSLAARVQDAVCRDNERPALAGKVGVNHLTLEMPAKHLGNATHVINWPAIASLLGRMKGLDDTWDPIRPFYVSDEAEALPSSVELDTLKFIDNNNLRLYLTYYMKEVHCFFPLIDKNDAEVLYRLTPEEKVGNDIKCLLNMALAFGALASAGQVGNETERAMVQSRCWTAAVTLIGLNATSNSIASIQATTLAAFYCGAQVRIFESLKYLRAASMMAQMFIKTCSRENIRDDLPNSFCCTFWCIYCYESDLLSELDFTSSGLNAYEDLVPYPSTNVDPLPIHLYTYEPATIDHSQTLLEEIAICQIVTNSSIRKSINRVNATIYSSHLDVAKDDNGYGNGCSWMLNYVGEFENHQHAIQDRLPIRMLTSPPNLGWNVNRLHRRMFALEYIIHRNFIDYVLHNAEILAADPLCEQILEHCKKGLEGCSKFLLSLTGVPINIITGMFAPGMAVMTMIAILLVAKASRALQAVLPRRIDTAISLGLSTLTWIASLYPSFRWHVDFLLGLKSHVDIE
ncbi:hypothetical protein V1525DRAFT_350723 [Lipomyces kononenkoae]|uniref:Uncharacterized protein n=1 Tax=Lipomyces kononenkoae TaxID=34357 RepID=A0ACC3SRG9_LIPKO